MDDKIKALDMQLAEFKGKMAKTRPGATMETLKRRALQVGIRFQAWQFWISICKLVLRSDDPATHSKHPTLHSDVQQGSAFTSARNGQCVSELQMNDSRHAESTAV